MDVIILFLLGVPVFVALSLIPHAKLGIVAGIGAAVLLCVLWIGEPMITSNDPAGNAMAMGFQAFAYVSAAGGGGVAALYHLTRLIWPVQGRVLPNAIRYVIFLVLSVPTGGLCLLIIEEMRFAI